MSTQTKIKKLSLKKTERPNYWHKDEKNLTVIYKSKSGMIRYRDKANANIEDLQIAYNDKIMYLWRNIFFKISELTRDFDFKFYNLVNSVMVDFRTPVYKVDNFYYLKIENRFFKVHTGTMRKLEVTSQQYLSLSSDNIILDFCAYDIKSPGSSVIYS